MTSIGTETQTRGEAACLRFSADSTRIRRFAASAQRSLLPLSLCGSVT